MDSFILRNLTIIASIYATILCGCVNPRQVEDPFADSANIQATPKLVKKPKTTLTPTPTQAQQTPSVSPTPYISIKDNDDNNAKDILSHWSSNMQMKEWKSFTLLGADLYYPPNAIARKLRYNTVQISLDKKKEISATLSYIVNSISNINRDEKVISGLHDKLIEIFIDRGYIKEKGGEIKGNESVYFYTILKDKNNGLYHSILCLTYVAKTKNALHSTVVSVVFIESRPDGYPRNFEGIAKSYVNYVDKR
ncbi:MAG: hypothetical protein NZM04_09545 [Methylacidiphilales bacterium]|nr:hypothetical protein [Candidatus Methylacidiphilales bacterium]